MEGFVLPAVFRVPSMAPGPTPRRLTPEPADAAGALRVGVPSDSPFTHLLLFEAPLALGQGRLVRVPNRPDLLPTGHLALVFDNGASLAPQVVPRAGLETGAFAESCLVEFSTPPDGPVRVWAATVSGDGMASELGGPWRIERPFASPAPPQLVLTVTADKVVLDWDWAAVAPVPVVVERADPGGGWDAGFAAISLWQARLRGCAPAARDALSAAGRVGLQQ